MMINYALFRLALAGVFVGFLPNLATAATLASWDFENGNLLASEQGNFVATSIDVVNGGPFAYAPGAGVGGGGALAYEQDPSHMPGEGSNIIFFTIENTHPIDPIELDESILSFGGGVGETYIIYFWVNMGQIGDINDSVPSQGPWTTFSFPAPVLTIPAGESFSIGWGLRDAGISDVSTHFLDNIRLTGTEPVPEPSVSLLLLVGAVSAGMRRRR